MGDHPDPADRFWKPTQGHTERLGLMDSLICLNTWKISAANVVATKVAAGLASLPAETIGRLSA